MPTLLKDRHAALSLSHRHHRRGLPLGEHLRARHSRARRRDRERGLRGARRHELRRPLAVRAAAKPCERVHPVDRRRGIQGRPRGRSGGAEPAQVHHRDPAQERRDPDLPLRRDTHCPAHPERHAARAARLHPHVRGHARVRRAAHHPRGEELPRFAGAAVLPRAGRLRAGRLVFMALPGALGRRCVPEEPGRPDVPPVLRREHAARGRVQLGRRARPAARPHRPGGGERAQRGAHLQRRPLLLRHQRHEHAQQDGVAPHGGARRRGGGRPQLPQVDPARDHHDRRGAGVPDAYAQPLRHHRADSEERVRARDDPQEDRRQPAAERRRREPHQAAHRDDHAEHLRRRALQHRDRQGHARRLDRHAALRRSLAAARRVPPVLQRLSRDGQVHRAAEAGDGVRDAIDAQAAGRPQPGFAGAGAGLADAQARPAPVQRGVPDAHVDRARSTRSSRAATWPRR